MQRIARGHSALAARTNGLPIAHRDGGKLAARTHGHCPAVLLRSGHPVRRAVIHREVVDLRRRLVQPRAPRHITRIVGGRIARNDRSLIARHDHRVRIVRRHPRALVVVAARRTSQRDPGFAAVLGSRQRDVRHVDDVRVARIDGDVLEVPSSSEQRDVARKLRPRRPRIVRSIDAPLLGRRGCRRTTAATGRQCTCAPAASWRRSRAGRVWRRSFGKEIVDHRVDTPRIGRRDGKANPADALRGQSALQLIPCGAAIG